jgi:hypothetical protein
MLTGVALLLLDLRFEPRDLILFWKKVGDEIAFACQHARMLAVSAGMLGGKHGRMLGGRHVSRLAFLPQGTLTC